MVSVGRKAGRGVSWETISTFLYFVAISIELGRNWVSDYVLREYCGRVYGGIEEDKPETFSWYCIFYCLRKSIDNHRRRLARFCTLTRIPGSAEPTLSSWVVRSTYSNPTMAL